MPGCKVLLLAPRVEDPPVGLQPECLPPRTTCLDQKTWQTQEEEKAWSQNLGHEHIRTTQNSYGEVPEYRQVEIMDGLRRQPELLGPQNEPDAETVTRVLAHIARRIGRYGGRTVRGVVQLPFQYSVWLADIRAVRP